MSVSVLCQACGKRLEVASDYKRRKMQCPACGVMVELPEPGAARQSPAAPVRAPKPTPVPAAAPVRRPTPPSVEPPAPRREKPKPKPQPAVTPVDDVEVVADVPPPIIPFAAEEKGRWDDDDGEPYALAEKLGRRCPECTDLLKPNAEVCTRCGYDFRLGRKPEKTYTPVMRVWEAGMPLHKRQIFFIAAEGVILTLGVVQVVLEGSIALFLTAWIISAVLLAFLLGTFDRIDFSRNQRGLCRLTKTWRYCFVPQPPQQVRLGEYEGVIISTVNEPGFWEWFLLIFLLIWGVIPGIIFWYFAFQRDNFVVSLTKDHGAPAFTVYKGWKEALAKEIAETLNEVAELPYERR